MSNNKKYPPYISAEHPEPIRASKDEKYKQAAYEEYMNWSGGEIPKGYHWDWDKAGIEPDYD